MVDIVDPFDSKESRGIVDPFETAPAAASEAQPDGLVASAKQGFKRSLPETKSLLYGALAAGAGAVGAEGARDWALKKYKDINTNEVEPLANKSGFIDAITGDGSIANWAGDTIGNFAGQALQSAAAAGIGAIAGSELPGAGNIAGAVGGLVAKNVVKDAVEKKVGQMIAGGVAKDVAEKAGASVGEKMLKRAGAGAIAGTGLNVGQEVGISYTGRAEDAEKAGQELTQSDATRAFAFGIPAGLLDTAAEGATALRALKGASTSEKLGRRVAAGAAQGALTEGTTEGLQAVLERAGAAQALTGEEAYKDYIENAAAGALGGGVMGGGSGIRRREEEGSNPTADSGQNPLLALAPPDGSSPYGVVNVSPDGTSTTQQQRDARQQADIDFAQNRADLGLTPDVNAARPGNPAAAPNVLLDGSPVPDPASGPLSRAVSSGVETGRVPVAPSQDVAALHADIANEQQAVEVGQQVEQKALAAGAKKQEAVQLGALAADERRQAAPPVNMDAETGEVVQSDPTTVVSYLTRQGVRGMPSASTISKAYGFDPETARAVRKEALTQAKAASRPSVEAAAAEAAMSPTNDRPAPTDAQKEAGNYKKGHVKVAGLDIAIENPAGTQRNPEWPPLANHYGYIKGSVGNDKDHVDVFLADGAEDASRPVFVVDQNDPKTGKFDEHKVVMGATTPEEARAIYKANYSPDWAGDGEIRQFTHDEFKEWVKNPKATNKPVASAPQYDPSTEVLDDDITPPSGGAFEHRTAADLAAKRAGKDAKTVQVEGGWVVRKPLAGIASPLQPAKSSSDTRQTVGSAAVHAENPENTLAADGALESSTMPPQVLSGVPETLPDSVGETVDSSSNATPDRTLVAVKDRSGTTHRVLKADLESERELLRIYNKDGTPKRNGKGGNSIHRENIANDEQRAQANKGLMEISRRGAKSERDAGFLKPESVTRQIKNLGLNPDDYEIRKHFGGFIGVRKAEEPVRAELSDEQAATVTEWALKNMSVASGFVSKNDMHNAADFLGRTDLRDSKRLKTVLEQAFNEIKARDQKQKDDSTQALKTGVSDAAKPFLERLSKFNKDSSAPLHGRVWKRLRNGNFTDGESIYTLSEAAEKVALDADVLDVEVSEVPASAGALPAPSAKDSKPTADDKADSQPTKLSNPDGNGLRIKAPKPGEKWYHGRQGDGAREFAAGRPVFFARDAESAEWYTRDDGTVTEHTVDVRNPARLTDFVTALNELGYGETDLAPDTKLAKQIANHSEYDGSNLNDAVYIPEVRALLEKKGFDGLLVHDVLENGSTEALIVWDPTLIDAAQANVAPAGGAVHVENGEESPATNSEIAAAAATAERAPRVTMKQAKADLVKQIDAALKNAPEANWPTPPELKKGLRWEQANRNAEKSHKAAIEAEIKRLGYITFNVEGDGEFKVIHSRDRLEEFRAKVEKEFKVKEHPQPKPASTSISEKERAKILAEAESVDEVAPSREAVEHNGMRIYPTTVGGNPRWAVQNGDAPATGDTLHPTLDEARKEADLERARREKRENSLRETEAQAKKAEYDARDKREDDANGFTAGMSPLQAGKVKRDLDKQLKFDGVIKSLRQYVDELHESGDLETSTFQEPKIKPMSRTRFNRATQREQDEHARKMAAAGTKTVYLVGESDVGKTAFDYANFLLAQNDSNGTEESGAESKQSPDAEVSTGNDVATPRMKNFGWDAVRLSDAYTFEELNALREQVEREHAKPTDENGHPLDGGIYLYDREGNRKLNALAWAVTYKIQESREAREAAAKAIAADEAPPNPPAYTRQEQLATQTKPPEEVVSAPVEPVEMTMAEWKATHKDFKGTIDGKRSIIRNGRLHPVTIVKEKPAEQAGHVETHQALMTNLRDGTATLDEYRSGWQSLVDNSAAIRAELEKMTKAKLVEIAGPRYRNDSKQDLVRAAMIDLRSDFQIGRGLSYMMGAKDAAEKAMGDLVARTTEADLKAYADRFTEAEEAAAQRTEAMKDPKTLEDFVALSRSVGGEASLSPEQRATFDSLRAEARREKRDADAKRNAVVRQVDTGSTGMTLVETKHTQKGHDLFVVQMDERVERDVYETLNQAAKRLGGRYSSYRGNGAVPGFTFSSREAAEQFMALRTGNVDTSAQQEARASAKADDRAGSLADKASALREKANASLSRDRLSNTSRRAQMAESAESEARRQLALADTMDRLADAIESGKARLLAFVRHRSQVEMLESAVKAAHWDYLRSQGVDWEKAKNTPLSQAQIVDATLPQFWLSRGDAAVLARRLQAVRGGKQIGTSLADLVDYGDEYGKAVQQNPTRFLLGLTGGGSAIFERQKDAKAALARSADKINGVVVKLPTAIPGFGQWAVAMSPELAIERKLWAPDFDKRITLNPTAAGKIMDLLDVTERRGDANVPYWWRSHQATRNQFAKLGIETNYEYREALREYLALREAPKGDDRVRKLERDLVGRKDVGVDFFPTPPAVVQRLIEQADIAPGMRVLEPSAGKGDIAEALRDAAEDVTVDTIEMSTTLRDILEAKGFDVTGADFLQYTSEPIHDRIVMNPPFGNDNGAAHVQHAYDLLKPGGRLVAVMGAGQRGKAQFDAWLESVGGLSEPLPEGSFKSSFRPTGVATQVVVIDKSEDGSENAAKFSRRGWGEFPDAVLGHGTGVASAHPDYAAAKAGDDAAALRLANDLVTPAFAQAVRTALDGKRPTIVPVLAVEAAGNNRIPLAVAKVLGKRLGWPLDTDIVQSHKVGRGGADGFHRLANSPTFAGPVKKGDYLIIDDTLTQGGTLAELKTHIEDNGGRVVLASALTGKGYSAKIAPNESTLRQLRERFSALEPWWRDAFGYGFEGLTESEARFLVKLKGNPSVDDVRNRILASRNESIGNVDGRGNGADGNSAPALKASPAAGGMTRAGVQSVVSKLKVASKVRVVQSAADLPAEVLAEAKRQNAGLSSINAAFYNGQSWIVADRMSDAGMVKRAVFHEVFAHGGLRVLYGTSVVDNMVTLASKLKGNGKASARVMALAQKQGINLTDYAVGLNQDATKSDRVKLAILTEELLAHMAETTGTLRAYLEEVLGAIRAFLRKYDFAELADLNAADLRFELRRAREAAQAGDAKTSKLAAAFQFAAKETPEPMFSRTIDGRGAIRIEHNGSTFLERSGAYYLVDDKGEPADFRRAEAERMAKKLDAVAQKDDNAPTWSVVLPGHVARAEEASTPMFSRDKDQTETPEFKRWFGDSKVVDENGKPLVVYHGTHGDFDTFDKSKSVAGSAAFYFAPTPDDVKGYAGSSGRVLPVFLRIQNPYEADGYSKYDFNFAPDKFAIGTLSESDVEALRARGYDGVVLNRPGRPVEYAVFSPEQIKSATGNNGNFDPENPDIRFSLGDALANAGNSARDVRLPAGYLLGDLLSTHANDGRLGWWHKTVGTQFNLAERNPLFRRVYDSVTRQISDLSHYANSAMDFAPSLLPKFDSIRDFGKKPISGADAAKVSDAVFDGTLRYMRDESGKPVPTGDSDAAGVVWSDDELRSMFGMNDAQIGYYREARSAIDKSLNDAGMSHMIRLANGDAGGQTDVAIAAPSARRAAMILRDALMDAAKFEPRRAKDLEEKARQVMGIADRIDGLTQKGYAPLSRFGQHTVYVTSDAHEPVFQMFETAREANRAARALRQAYPTSTVERGTLSQDQFKQFRGMTPDTLELFGEVLGLDRTGDSAQDEVFQAFLRAAKANSSAMKRLIHRKGIEGFSTDAPRVLASFIYSNARLTAANLNATETQRAIADIPKEQGQIKDAAIRMTEYVDAPQEPAAKVGAFNFAQYLGGSIASAMVNMTQPLTMTFPWLSQYGGAWVAARALKDAGVIAASNKPTGDTMLDVALARAAKDGITQPQEVHQLQAYASGKGSLRSGDGTKAGDAAAKAHNAYMRAMLGWGAPFALAEQYNRRMTFVAAFNIAREQGMADPYTFAVHAVNTTQGVYSKANKPTWARSTLGGMAFTFKQYSINYVEMLHRMWGSGPDGKKAVLRAAAVMFILSGASGLPGADDLDDLLDGLMQRLGFNWDTKQQREEFFAGILGEDAAKFMEHGLSSIPGMPIDVSGRLGMGNLIPSTGLLTQKDDHTRDVLELVGPTGDFASRSFQSANSLVSGDIGGAVKSIVPRALANAWQGIDMLNKGYYADSKGRKVLDTSLTEAAAKGIGFQPASVAKVQQASGTAQQMVALNRLKEAEIADKFAKAAMSQDQGALEDAREALRAWNRRNPESPIKITSAQIRKRVQNMQMDKQTRLAKAAPKEVRRQVQETLRAGQG